MNTTTEPSINGKSLQTGVDYREIFGLPETCKMVYLGNDTWQATRTDGAVATMTSKPQTDKARAYVCRATISMGSPR